MDRIGKGKKWRKGKKRGKKGRRGGRMVEGRVGEGGGRKDG